jgi:hypothetical protein
MQPSAGPARGRSRSGDFRLGTVIDNLASALGVDPGSMSRLTPRIVMARSVNGCTFAATASLLPSSGHRGPIRCMGSRLLGIAHRLKLGAIRNTVALVCNLVIASLPRCQWSVIIVTYP